MGEKVTVMVLKVDLQCPCCYKKVKKILCKFPQIRDQIFNEKANTVTITVVCCSPEKLRDKLCCKGSKVIKSIEIVEPLKPKPTDKHKESEKHKEQEPEKNKEKTPPPPPPGSIKGPSSVCPPVRTCCEPCSEGYGGGPCYSGFGVAPPPSEKTKEKPPTPPPPPPIKGPSPVYPPVRTCCEPCSEGHGGGPCYSGFGVAPPPSEKPKEKPAPPPMYPCGPPMGVIPVYPCGYPPARTCCGPCSEGRGGGPCYFGFGEAPPPQQPCYDGYGYGYRDRPCHVTRCDYYLSDENPQSCSIM